MKSEYVDALQRIQYYKEIAVNVRVRIFVFCMVHVDVAKYPARDDNDKEHKGTSKVQSVKKEF